MSNAFKIPSVARALSRREFAGFFALIILSVMMGGADGTANFVMGPSAMSWQQAEEWCLANYGTHLASIHSEEESAEANDICTSQCWLGGTCQNGDHGDWVWTDSSAWDYTHWAGGQPDDYWGATSGDDCVQQYGSGPWGDQKCSYSLNPLCAAPAASDSAKFHWIVGGHINRFINNNIPIAECKSDSSTHSDHEASQGDDQIAVSCCTDSEGVREFSGETKCFQAVSYDEAVAKCSEHGYRLCTLKEMLNEKTKGKGCSHNSRYNWVSDVCKTVFTKKEKECIPSRFIDDADECEAAANALGIRWNSCCQNSNNLPYGCLQRADVDVIWNGKADTPNQFPCTVAGNCDHGMRWAVCRRNVICDLWTYDYSILPKGVCMKASLQNQLTSYKVTCTANGAMNINEYANGDCSDELSSVFDGKAARSWDIDSILAVANSHHPVTKALEIMMHKMEHWTGKTFCHILFSLDLGFGKMQKIAGMGGCVELMMRAAALCQILGLGPANPFSDLCMVGAAAAVGAECKKVIDEGVEYATDACVEAVDRYIPDHRRMMASSPSLNIEPLFGSDCGFYGNEACEHPDASFFRATHYFGVTSCSPATSDSFSEIAYVTDVCHNGRRYSCDGGQVTVQIFEYDDCTGTLTEMTLGDHCDVGLGFASKYECSSDIGTNMAASSNVYGSDEDSASDGDGNSFDDFIPMVLGAAVGIAVIAGIVALVVVMRKEKVTEEAVTEMSDVAVPVDGDEAVATR